MPAARIARAWKTSAMDDERQVWAIKVVIEATKAQAEQAVEAIARTLCPDEHHAGSCPVPWTTMTCLLRELPEGESLLWREEFEEERRQAEANPST